MQHLMNVMPEKHFIGKFLKELASRVFSHAHHSERFPRFRTSAVALIYLLAIGLCGVARAGTAYTDSFIGTSLNSANWGASGGYPGASNSAKGLSDSFTGTSLNAANWGASGGYPGATNSINSNGFADSFLGASLNPANWGASGGNSGSTNSVSNGLQLTTGTQSYGESWVQAAASNYSYVNTTESFQASLSGFSNPSANGAGFSIYLVGGDATSAESASFDPCYYSPSVIQFWIFSNGSGGYTVQLYGKTYSPHSIACFRAQLSGYCASDTARTAHRLCGCKCLFP